MHLSRDGVVVVHHDRHARPDDEPPGSRGRADRRRTVARRRRVLFRTAAAFRFAAGESACRRWPTCSLGTATCRIIVELKVNRAELARATVEAVRAAGAVDRVCLGSFGARVLRAARALEPAIATSAAGGSALGAVPIVVPVAGLTGSVRRVSGAGVGGPHPRRLAALRRGCASRRPWRPGLDGRRTGRREAIARMGRRRADHRPAGSDRASGALDGDRERLQARRSAALPRQPTLRVGESAVSRYAGLASSGDVEPAARGETRRPSSPPSACRCSCSAGSDGSSR